MSNVGRRDIPLSTSGRPATNRKASQEIRYLLADNLKPLRKERGYTQRELADVCHWHKNYISNVEQGTVNITLGNLEVLAAGLKCREFELLQARVNAGFVAEAVIQGVLQT